MFCMNAKTDPWSQERIDNFIKTLSQHKQQFTSITSIVVSMIHNHFCNDHGYHSLILYTKEEYIFFSLQLAGKL